MSIRIAGCFLLNVLLLFPIGSQQSGSVPSSNSPRRDAKAVSTVQDAVSAMGGAAASAQIQSVIAQGTVSPTPGGSDPEGSVTLKDQFSASGHDFRDQFQSLSQNQLFVSGHGSPALASGSHIRAFQPPIADLRVPAHLPVLVLSQDLANPNCDFEFIGPTLLNGQSAIQIRVHIDTDPVRQALSLQDWYFDPVTKLPIRIEYRLPDAANATWFMPAAVEFSNFKTAQGFLFPFQLHCFRDGTLRSTLKFSSFVINQQIGSSEFDLPTTVTR